VGGGERISDFNATDDSEDIFLDFLLSGTFSFVGDESTAFAGGGNASARFNDSTKLLEIDTNGDAAVDMEMTLMGVDLANLGAADFTVI
jgi:hypothetical protein